MPQRAKSRVAAAALIADYLLLGQLSRAFWFVSLALVGTAILTLSAKIKVDLVYVNVTMQTFAVFAIAALYGSRLAVATVALYLLEGALGMPVFTGTPEKGIGLAYMVGPTGGYLLSYLAAAWIVGRAADKDLARNPFALGGVMLLAEAVILVMGAGWMAYLFGFEKGIAFGFGIFIVGDLVKLALAAIGVPAVTALVKR
ncbi:biotin transporter BioY [Brucella suis]|uniref:Biotin transporter n=1 Tax=Brucella suis (strain ATCC 23445 / NCTC 10510) TaxID=470137 RepID=B0CKI9_BRUSI|nr:biotin transporter BioY [Brucella suis]ABY37619.1 Protein bioY [Brucella suis ATCC 23445]AIB17250.1 Substrate-specific component BioY of biotin ECF transporter [Brucella suis bv. 2]AIB21297.1 Substrate-specific component BioY of biotin ECF transporter [Brucella suis bv. 2]AIB24651.1 Substrate-specific component BioY of biotin ECF transporter [Brucella suis bv. 2]AIB28048.1 Substrate-specific component BioY of biotin ECF transporter [Brucella suis bv. 2]